MEKARDKNKRKRLKDLKTYIILDIEDLIRFGLVNPCHKNWVIKQINNILVRDL